VPAVMWVKSSHTQLSSSAKAGDLIRCGFSVHALLSPSAHLIPVIPAQRLCRCAGMTEIQFRDLAARNARALLEIPALKIERAQGMPDARCTRGLMRNMDRKCAHEHTGQRRQSDIPCAMALRLITSSPRRTTLLPPLRPEKQLPPGALTPAPRRQDHTSSPYAFAPFVFGTTGVHRHPSHVRERS
jgi:hypothetical protein